MDWLMRHLFHRFIDDQAGVTSIEYAFISVLIAVVIVTAVTAVGSDVSAIFTSVNTAFAG
jgi:pilus assembly protein Flp/PilA